MPGLGSDLYPYAGVEFPDRVSDEFGVAGAERERMIERRSTGTWNTARSRLPGIALAVACLACFAPPGFAAGKKPPAPASLAAGKPAPVVKPVATKDPIASVINSADDDPSGTKAGDSDAPEVAAPRSFPPPATRPVVPPTFPQSRVSSAGFTIALQFLDGGDPAAATLAAFALPDRVDIKIIDWLVATGGYAGVPSSRIADVAKRLSDWPGQTLLRVRYEQALAHENVGAQAVIKALGDKTPISPEGVILLGKAYLEAGRKDDAAALIRTYWRTAKFTDQVEATIRSTFGSLITAADHKARMDRLLYDEQTVPALREAAVLGKDQRLLAAGVIAVIKHSRNAEKALANVPNALKKDPLYIYSRIQSLRRADKLDAAASLMLSAPRDPKVLVDPDAWWVERRVISRGLIDKGDAKTAYKLVAGAAGESTSLRAEAEFHAGWYALEFLRDPARAKSHFLAIEAVSTLPLSQSRAEYWLGRAAAAAGNTNEATSQFKRAATYPTTFYGQLALSRLGIRQLRLSAPPAATADVRARFAARELVQVIAHLTAAHHDDRVDIFYRTLAETLDDPAEIALLCAMADANGEHQIALQVGKVALSRGLPVETLAFPTSAIPLSAKTDPVEKPVVYAIARQESAFNQEAVSSAGALGLLQLMPATAKQTANSVGLPYSKARLTQDAAYNATLGAAHLGTLFDDFGGSYVMTFASYNAGKSRILDWTKAHGDPRDPKTDVVNWIELIPFTETRNYVQRIMENLQVYRARLGSSALTIDADLKRGKIVATD